MLIIKKQYPTSITKWGIKFGHSNLVFGLANGIWKHFLRWLSEEPEKCQIIKFWFEKMIIIAYRIYCKLLSLARSFFISGRASVNGFFNLHIQLGQVSAYREVCGGITIIPEQHLAHFCCLRPCHLAYMKTFYGRS